MTNAVPVSSRQVMVLPSLRSVMSDQSAGMSSHWMMWWGRMRMVQMVEGVAWMWMDWENWRGVVMGVCGFRW